jgi:tetrapyrrole methylase family protein/MazG family protein
MEGFMEMVAHLRSPEGCPWDREQTHQSLRTSLLEETYEVLSALDNQDPKSLREELGDLLLQIVLHAQIAMENGAFKMSDVFAGIYRKIVFRHPHVFTQQPAGSTQSVLRNWEKLKEIERKENGGKGGGLLSGVPKIYPSLAQAQAYQERVKRVGFDWAKIDSVLEKVYEELDEVKNAEGTEELNAELGDLLFSVVNLVRWNKADAESVLREANQRFLQRFQFVEQKAGELGRQLGDMTLGEMDVLWDEAKENGL